jgi:hypothetical protein
MWILFCTQALAEPLPATVSYDPGDGFTLRTDDGSHAVTLGARLQVRSTLAARDDDLAVDVQIRRLRLTWKGHTLAPWNRWAIQLAFSDDDVDLNDDGPARPAVADAFWNPTASANADVRVGQYKIPFSRRRISSTSTLMFVDRELLDDEFGLDRDRGANLRASLPGADGRPMLRTYLGIFRGQGREAALDVKTTSLSMARVEAFPLGGFDYYEEADLARSPSLKLGFGGGVAYHSRAVHLRGVGGPVLPQGDFTNNVLWTADLSLRYRGLSIDAAASGRHAERAGVALPVEELRGGAGWTAQIGVLLPDAPVNFAARHTLIRGDAGSVMPDQTATGGSLTWYLMDHDLDLTTDVFVLEEDGQRSTRMRVQLELVL